MPKAAASRIVSKREEEKKASLDALARVAFAVSGGNPNPAPSPKARQEPARKSTLPAPPPKPAPRPAPKLETDFERQRKAQALERKAKLEEERALRERRERELAGSKNLQWRGQWTGGDMPGVRRTAFDRIEPSLAEKLHGVLGEVQEKDSRAKNREKGRRQGGR